MKTSSRIKENDWVDVALKGHHSCYQLALYWVAPPSWPRRLCCDFLPYTGGLFRNTKVCWTVAAILVITYLAIMDILLYSYFRWSNLVHDSKKGGADELYTPFTHLSVKALMLDEPSQFLKTPAAEYFNSVTGFSSVFPFITPNVISVTHLLCGFLAGKFVASATLNDRRIGVTLFCVRNWLDALDGVVFRAQSNTRLQFKSHPSTLGYFIDAGFDTLGGFFLCFGILFHLIKRFGPKKCHLLPLRRTTANGGGPPTTLTTAEPGSMDKGANGSLGGKEDARDGMDMSGEEIFTVSYLFSKTLALGLCLGLAGMGWNYSMQGMSTLFQTEIADEKLSLLQFEQCHSTLSIAIFMAWRLIGSMAILNYILLAIFFDYIWQFLQGPHLVLLGLNFALLGLSHWYMIHIKHLLQI